MRIIDLSQDITPDMGVFPGDPLYCIERMISMPESVCNVSLLKMSSHTGTHMDAPLHFIDGGTDVSLIALEKLMGKAIVASCPVRDGFIRMSDIAHGLSKRKDENILILKTGWESKLGTDEFFTGSPSFDELDGELLTKNGITAIATDMPTVKTMGAAKKAHDELLSRGILIVEGLINLDELPDRVTFCASPLKIKGCDGSPVRAFAVSD